MNDHSDNREPIPGDPKLTAFALGELPQAERAEFAATLSGSPEQQTAAEIARCGELVRQAVRTAPLPPPSPELRRAVLARLAAPTPAAPARVARYPVPPRRFWLPLSLAASVLASGGATWLLWSMRHSEALVAERVEFIGGVGDGSDQIESITFEEPSPRAAETIAAAAADDEPLQLEAAAEAKSHFKRASGEVKRPLLRALGGSPSPGELAKMRDGEMSNRATTMGGATPGNGASTPGQGRAKRTTWERGDLEMERRRAQMGGAGMGGAPGRRMSGATGVMGGMAGEPHAPASPTIIQESEENLLARRNMGAGATFIGARGADQPEQFAGEAYTPITENPFLAPADHPLSTFSIDVDTASYANVRRYLNAGALPPAAAVRIEELVNYFPYDYPQPEGDVPFSATMEVAGCPWAPEHRLLRVGLKGREVPSDQRPASNLVFLLDVSGSMDRPNKLPLVKEAMQLVTDQLTENDRVAIVVYAGTSGLALPPTNGDDKQAIRAAIAGLSAGGSTNGGQGLQMAYDAAQRGFIRGGTNRVVLATDGDFNVGVTDRRELVCLVEERAADGVQFTALGFGIGNLKDATLEQLADKGNGNYAYIDTLAEARKVLVEQLSGTLVTIAKDVKVQIEFNPARVAAYRLIGYENRLLRDEDFNDDRKDAGEVGAGHTVTALFELAPAGDGKSAGVDELKYQRESRLTEAAASGELLTLKLRYKEPDGRTSRLWQRSLSDEGKPYGQASGDFKFAAAVAAFGMLLRGSEHAGNATFDAALELAGEGLRFDPHGYRSEFLELVRRAKQQAPRLRFGPGKK